MIEQSFNNLDLTQQMIEDHQERLRAAYTPPRRSGGHRTPGQVRMACGRMLIQLGERIRGAQSAPVDTQPAQLALGK